MLDVRVGSAHDHVDDEPVPEEVAALAIGAGEIGFSPARVATALGVSPRALASIERAAAPVRRHFIQDRAAVRTIIVELRRAPE